LTSTAKTAGAVAFGSIALAVLAVVDMTRIPYPKIQPGSYRCDEDQLRAAAIAGGECKEKYPEIAQLCEQEAVARHCDRISDVPFSPDLK